MDKVVNDILSSYKGKKQIDKIVKIGETYVISLSDNGLPVIDESYAYKNGKIFPFSPIGNISEISKAAKSVVYDRRKKRK